MCRPHVLPKFEVSVRFKFWTLTANQLHKGIERKVVALKLINVAPWNTQQLEIRYWFVTPLASLRKLQLLSKATLNKHWQPLWNFFFLANGSGCIKITQRLYSYANKLARTLLSCDIKTSAVNVIHKKYEHLKLSHSYCHLCWTVSRFIMDVLNTS